jgi:hypothetical protein
MEENDLGLRTFTSGEALAIHRRVKLNSSQVVVYADADDIGIGTTTMAAADASAVTVKLWNYPGTRKMVCSAAVDIGDTLYGTDDGKVEDTHTSDGPALGVALQAGSADAAIIEVLMDMDRGGNVYTAIAASTDVENTVTETAFSTGSKTIDGSKLRAGDVIHVVAQGIVTDQNSTDTLTVKLYVGTEEIVTTGAVDSADNDIFYIDAYITVRIAGSGGHIQACGVVANGVEGTVTAKPFRKADAAEDLSWDVAVACKATWSVAHADNEVNLDTYFVEIKRQ